MPSPWQNTQAGLRSLSHLLYPQLCAESRLLMISRPFVCYLLVNTYTFLFSFLLKRSVLSF